MKDKLENALSQALVAFLFALGLTLPVLFALELQAWWPLYGGILAGLALAGGLCTLKKGASWVLAAAAATGIAVWLLALGGLSRATEVIQAVLLQFSGYQGALPLVAQECAGALAVLFGLVSLLLTGHSMGFYPSLTVQLLVLMLLWLTGHSDLAVYALPGCAALIVQFVRVSHEEIPLRRVLPIAVIAAAACLLLVPSGGVTNAALKDTADTLRQRIYDYLFFTEPRNVFSLSSEGYYPQGQTQLGGAAQPTDHPVMQVRTPKKTYLRGAVMNEYTGRTWHNTTGGRRYLFVSPRWTAELKQIFDMSLPGGTLSESAGLLQEQTVTVQLLADNASSLFVPQRVRTLQTKGDLVTYFNNASELFVTRDLKAGDTYQVTAPLLVAGDAGLGTLVEAASSREDSSYAAVQETYTQLPGHLQQQVFDIAVKAVGTAQTPYEQAFAIQNYLSRNYRYTLEVTSQNENFDFVTDFLINTREGYCTYFASAMTVLCRMAGLPARYVEGYLALPDTTGVAYVTGLNAHAWTEVYFSGFGWVTFDATPATGDESLPSPQSDQGGDAGDAPTPTPTPPTGADMETPAPDEQPSPEPDQSQTPPDDEETPTISPKDAPNVDSPPNQTPPDLRWLLWLLAVLALCGGVGARVWWTLPQTRAKKATAPDALFMVWVQAVHDALRVLGRASQPTESPMAYGKRLDREGGLAVEMYPLGETIALVLYGKVVPEPEEIAMVKTAYEALLRAMNPFQRLRLTAERAVLPAKKTNFAAR